MSLVGSNTLTLNHDSVVSIMSRHLSNLLSPDIAAIKIIRVEYDEHADGVRVTFEPDGVTTKDPFMDNVRERCLEQYCSQCDACAGDPCAGAPQDFLAPGVHMERLRITFQKAIEF